MSENALRLDYNKLLNGYELLAKMIDGDPKDHAGNVIKAIKLVNLKESSKGVILALTDAIDCITIAAAHTGGVTLQGKAIEQLKTISTNAKAIL